MLPNGSLECLVDDELLMTIFQMARSKELVAGIGRYSRSDAAAHKSDKSAEAPAFTVRSSKVVRLGRLKSWTVHFAGEADWR